MQVNSARLGFGRGIEVDLRKATNEQRSIAREGIPKGVNRTPYGKLRIIPNDNVPLIDDFKYCLKVHKKTGLPIKYTTGYVSSIYGDDSFSDSFIKLC